MENWGLEIKKLRLKAGLTQEELSQKTGLGRSAIARIENGNYQNMRAKWLPSFAAAFKITVNELKHIVYGIPSQNLELEKVPVFREYPYTGGSMPIEFVHRERRNMYKYVEAYRLNVHYFSPDVKPNDVILTDKKANIEVGDLVLCLRNGSPCLGTLKNIDGGLFIDCEKGLCPFSEVASPSLVIGIEKQLK